MVENHPMEEECKQTFLPKEALLKNLENDLKANVDTD